MARDFDGTSDYGVDATFPNQGNITISFWFNADTLPSSTERYVFSTVYDSSEAEAYGTQDKSAFIDSSGNIGVYIYDGASKSIKTTSGGASTGTWNHYLAVIDGTNMSIWINGANKATLSAGSSYTGITNPDFGMCRTVTNLSDGESSISRFDGKLAEFCIWDTGLPDSVADILATGVVPSKVFPQNIMRYWPLMGNQSPENEMFGGNELTLTSAPPKSAHPPVFMPSAQIIQFPPVGAVGGEPLSAFHFEDQRSIKSRHV